MWTPGNIKLLIACILITIANITAWWMVELPLVGIGIPIVATVGLLLFDKLRHGNWLWENNTKG